MRFFIYIIFFILIISINCANSEPPIKETTKEVTYNPRAKLTQVELALECSTIVILETEKGIIKFALFEKEAPKNTSNIIKLINEGFYDSTYFHRIVKDKTLNIIQGGDPNTKDNDPKNDGFGGVDYTVEDEFTSKLRHIRGTVSMANSGANTNGCQFFICLDAEFHLNNRYTIIGQVISNMEVSDNIEKGDKILHATIEKR